MHFIHLLNIPTSGIEWHNLTNYTYRICSFIYRMERGGRTYTLNIWIMQILLYQFPLSLFPSSLFLSLFQFVSPSLYLSSTLFFMCSNHIPGIIHSCNYANTAKWSQILLHCDRFVKGGRGIWGRGREWETEKEEDRWMRSCDREGEIIIL